MSTLPDHPLAIITGASAGIALATARGLAGRGYRLLLNARGAARLEAVATSLRDEFGAEVTTFAGDISEAAVASALVKLAHDELGGASALVYNTGGPKSGTFVNLSAEDWQHGYETTLLGFIRMCQLVIPGMVLQGYGRIVNVSSVSALRPVQNLIISNTMRGGLNGFVRSLSAEVAAQGITVNNVNPGRTNTERLESLAEATMKATGKSREELYAMWEEGIPSRRIAEAEEVAAAILFLLSPESSQITGINLPVDGGWSAGY